LDDVIEEIAGEVAGNKEEDPGMVFLATHEKEGSKLVVSLKRKGIIAPIIGGDAMGDNSFAARFREYPEEKAYPGYFTDGIYATSPVIFDVADEKVWQFREAMAKKYGQQPAWTDTTYYEAALTAVQAIKKAGVQGKKENLTEDRIKIRDALAGFDSIENAVEGITGNIYFDRHGNTVKPLAVGFFQNQNFISALTQLQPVSSFNRISNFQEEIETGRMLIVQDKHMYKTNVVYAGIEIHEISDLDIKNLLCTLDFSLWFRYRGQFDPHNIEFLNSVKPIHLETPSYEEISDQFAHRLYRIKGQFKADSLSLPFIIGQHILGLSFRHRDLSRNNLIYVVDMLGMELTSGISLREELEQANILSPTWGWVIDQGWMYQDIAKKSTQGKPQYLNLRKGKADYSRFNFGVRIEKDTFSFRRLIPAKFAKYLSMVSCIMIVLIVFAGKRSDVQHLSKSLWFFLVIFTVLFLLSSESFLVDWLTDKIRPYYLGRVILTFDVLWWVIPAILITRVIERFFWIPLEVQTERSVPNIVRVMTASLVYLLMIFGIVAFVFNQKITGLLATSGVLAMIVGFAIQLNISNFFSGIALSIERTFRVGDWVKIGNNTGKIVDMTWRTTRIQTSYQNVISVPNSMASESIVKNFNYPDDTFWKGFIVHIDPIHSPARVEKLLRDAVLSVQDVLKPWVMFAGVSDWSARYWVYFLAKDYEKRNTYIQAVWESVWTHLNRAGIEFAIKDRERHQFKRKPAKTEG